MNKYDPHQNQKSTILEIVRNKNNLLDLNLRNKVQQYKKIMSVSVSDLEQERLDVFDFYNRLHVCESDAIDEFKWLLEDIKTNPPSKDGGPVILPLINTNITPGTKDHPDINGAFGIDIMTLNTVPAANLWTDPALITLKDLSVRNITKQEKKPWTKIKSERCLQRLAATGWMDAILEIEAREKEKQERLANLDAERKKKEEESKEENNEDVKSEDTAKISEDTTQNQPHQQPAIQAQKDTVEYDLPPTGNMPRMRSELVIPAAVDDAIRNENTKMRPSTTEKLKKKISEIIGNPMPVQKQGSTTSQKENEEEGAACTLPPISNELKLVQNIVNTWKGERKEDGECIIRQSKAQREREKSNEILRLVLERKAEKIGKKRRKKVPIEERMKEFYAHVEEVKPKEDSKTGLRSILAFLSTI